MDDKQLNVISVTSSSAHVQVEQLTLNETMSPYYFYVLQYKEGSMEFSDGPRIPHKDASRWVVATIDDLRSAREYVIQVTPFRMDIDNGITEVGWPTGKLSLKTGEYNLSTVHLNVHSFHTDLICIRSPSLLRICGLVVDTKKPHTLLLSCLRTFW